jgi:hypothetical protein
MTFRDATLLVGADFAGRRAGNSRWERATGFWTLDSLDCIVEVSAF